MLVAFAIIAIVQVILKIISVENGGSITDSFYDPKLYFSLLLCVVALAVWFISASQIEFSVLLPMNILTIVISGFIGYFIFNEEISVRKIISYVLILAGVFILAYSKTNGTSHYISDINKTIDVKDVGNQ